MNRRGNPTIERAVQLAPFAGRHDRTGRQPHGLEHHPDPDRVGREHLTEQGHGRPLAATAARCLHRALLGLGARILKHGAGEHVLRLGMGRHPESGHVDAENTHAVELFGQETQGYAGGGRHAEVDHHDGIVVIRIGELEYRLAHVLEERTRDQGLRVEGHITDRATCAVEMGGKGQTVDTTAGACEYHGRAPHAQPDPQGAERRTHGLGLIVRSLRIVPRVALQQLAVSRCGRGGVQGLDAAVTATALPRVGRAITDRTFGLGWLRHRRRSPRARVS